MSKLKKGGRCKKTSLSYKAAHKVVARARIYRKTDLAVYRCKNCSKYHVTGILDWVDPTWHKNRLKETIMTKDRKMLNEGRTLVGLRSGDYSAVSAIADLVDNGKDAGAKRIVVDFQSSGNSLDAILIADNGKGMDREGVIEALKLGSNREYDKSKDLGCFGFGLVTASTSQGKRVIVISKRNGEYSTGILDVDTIVANDKYDIEDRHSNAREMDILDSYIPKGDNSGTVVIISELDQCSYKRTNGLTNALRKHLGITFRRFINSKELKIVLKDQVVRSINPIHDFENTPIIDEQVVLPSGLKARITTYFVGDRKPKTSELNPTFKSQNAGYSVLRNNREIVRAGTLGIYQRNSTINRFRGEIELSGDMDGRVKTDYKKTNIQLNEEDIECIKSIHKSGMGVWNSLNQAFKQLQLGEIEETTPQPPAKSAYSEAGLSGTAFDESVIFLKKLKNLLQEFGEEHKFNKYKALYKGG